MDLSSNLVPKKKQKKKKKKKTNYLAWWQRKPTDVPLHKNQINRKKGGKKSHRYNHILLLFLCSLGLYMSVGTYRIGEQGWQCEEYCHFAKRAASSYSEILSARKLKILILP